MKDRIESLKFHLDYLSEIGGRTTKLSTAIKTVDLIIKHLTIIRRGLKQNETDSSHRIADGSQSVPTVWSSKDRQD